MRLPSIEHTGTPVGRTPDLRVLELVRPTAAVLQVALLAVLVPAIGCDGGRPSGLVGTGESVSATIGAEGGAVSVDGATLTVPAGALPEDEDVTVTSTTEPAPDEYRASSPVYLLEPEGLVFAEPVEITLPLIEPRPQTTVFWSRLGADGYDDVGGTTEGSTITAQNTHFSTVFAGEGPARLEVAPTTHDFGPVALGVSSPSATFTLTNTGQSNSDVIVVTGTGGDAGSFPFETTCGAALAPGESCALSATFVPSVPGARSAALSAASSQGGTVAVNLEGTGVVSAALGLSPGSHDFGTVLLGTSAEPAVFTLENAGGVSSGDVEVIMLGDTAFAMLGSGCGGPLGPGASCTVEVSFEPVARGARSALLTVTDSLGGSTSATLVGVAALPAELAASPASLGFPATLVGDGASSVAVSISNAGDVPSGELSLALGGAHAGDFAMTSDACTGSVLMGGASCTASLSFAPIGGGSRVAELQVSDANGAAMMVSLSGSGIPGATLAPSASTQSFGAIALGSSSDAATITVANEGGTTSGVVSVTLAGVDANAFSILSTSCGTPLAPGGECTAEIDFTPTRTGPHSAGLSVSASPGGALAVALDGSGTDPTDIRLAPTPFVFTPQGIGQESPPAQFVLTNPSGVTVTPSSVAITGTCAASFTIVADACSQAAINPGQDCSVSVVFTPASAGACAASLDVDAGTGGTASAAISGSGLSPATLSVSPATWDFGALVVGGASAPATFTVTNAGMAPSGDVAATLTGASALEFLIESSDCTGSLAPGETCTIEASFTPDVAGSSAAALEISAAPGGSSSVSLTGMALNPGQLLLSGDGGFGTVLVGGTASRVFVLSNAVGSETSGPIAVWLSGGGSAQFTVTSNSCTTLIGGASCTIGVRFAPGSAGAWSASLRASSIPGGDVAIALGGTGDAGAALSWSPPSEDFGAVALAHQTGWHQFTLDNAGSVATGPVAIQLGGPAAADYSIAVDECSGVTLQPGAGCAVAVNFAPSVAGVRSATLQGSSTSSSAQVALSGSGYDGGYTLQVDDLDLGTVAFNQSTMQSLFVANTGSYATGPLSVVLGGASAFTISNDHCTGATLDPGEACWMDLGFAPTATGSFSATLTATTPDASDGATLTGVGVDGGYVLQVADVDFETVPINQSRNHPRYVLNSGSYPTGPIALALTGPGASAFTISNDNCTGATLDPGEACWMDLSFAPTATGSFSATLTATTPDASDGATLTGVGVDGGYVLQVADVDFETVAINQSRNHPRYVLNSGSYPTGPISLALTGPGASAFEITEDACTGATLNPGEACGLNLWFAPTTAGSSNATLTATTADATASGNLSGIAFDAGYLLDASDRDFETVPVSQQRPHTLYVWNAGSWSTGPLTIALSGASDFAVTNDQCTGATLVPGTNTGCFLEVRFAPSSAGSFSASLQVTSPETTATAALTGIGVEVPPTLLFGPSIRDYGRVAVDQTIGVGSVDVWNSGSVPTGPVSIELQGPDASEFPITGENCSGATLAAGGACTVFTSFSPASLGAKSASLLVTTPDVSGTASLSGEGVAFLVAPSGHDFGYWLEGSTPSQVFTVTNTSTVSTGAIAAALSGTGAGLFSWTNDCTILAPAATCSIAVEFHPVEGLYQDARIDLSSVPGGSQTISVLGGSPALGGPLTIAPTSADFGSVTIGQVSSPQTFTVTNTGASTTNPFWVGTIETHATDFHAAGACGSLPPAGTCEVSVSFLPTASGLREANLMVQVNGGPQGAVVAALSGTGQ